jgi:hypothetical protein
MRAAPRRTAGEAPLGSQMVEHRSDVSGDVGDASARVTRRPSGPGTAVGDVTQSSRLELRAGARPLVRATWCPVVIDEGQPVGRPGDLDLERTSVGQGDHLGWHESRGCSPTADATRVRTPSASSPPGLRRQAVHNLTVWVDREQVKGLRDMQAPRCRSVQVVAHWERLSAVLSSTANTQVRSAVR